MFLPGVVVTRTVLAFVFPDVVVTWAVLPVVFLGFVVTWSNGSSSFFKVYGSKPVKAAINPPRHVK